MLDSFLREYMVRDQMTFTRRVLIETYQISRPGLSLPPHLTHPPIRRRKHDLCRQAIMNLALDEPILT